MTITPFHFYRSAYNAHSGAFSRNAGTACLVSAKSNGSMRIFDAQRCKTLIIPRVFVKINQLQIRETLESLNLGIIERIDVKKGDKFNRVFIHYREWFNNENAALALERLSNGQEIKVIYESPWFWKISAYDKNRF